MDKKVLAPAVLPDGDLSADGFFTTAGAQVSGDWARRGCPCSPNRDGSRTPPVLKANDFICFLNRFAAGCP